MYSIRKLRIEALSSAKAFIFYFAGYSKSSVLDLAEVIAESAAKFCFVFDNNQQFEEETIEEALSDDGEKSELEGTVVSQKSTRGITDKVVFNDGTAAGVLSNLKGGTKTMHLHEADVSLKSMGLMLPSPADIVPYRVDPFRSTLMTLHEKPGHFSRVLKKETINVHGSKLNIFVRSYNQEYCAVLNFFNQGASTGDLIAAELVRQAACLAADALFERFILWPIDGEPIPNENCITSIDFSQYPSLEQFGVMCGFFGDLILDLEQPGKDMLAEQAYDFRIAGRCYKYFL